MGMQVKSGYNTMSSVTPKYSTTMQNQNIGGHYKESLFKKKVQEVN